MPFPMFRSKLTNRDDSLDTLPFALNIDWSEAVVPITPRLTFPLNHGQDISDEHFLLTTELPPYRLVIDFSDADTSDRFVMISTAQVESLQTPPYLLEQYFISITRPHPKFPDCITINGPVTEQNLGPTRLMIYEPPVGPWVVPIYLTQLEGKSRLIRWAFI